MEAVHPDRITTTAMEIWAERVAAQVQMSNVVYMSHLSGAPKGHQKGQWLLRSFRGVLELLALRFLLQNIVKRYNAKSFKSPRNLLRSHININDININDIKIIDINSNDINIIAMNINDIISWPCDRCAVARFLAA